MKSFLISTFFLICIPVFSQVHQSLLAHLNDLPAFPVSSADAYSKCTSQQTGACDADSVIAAFNAKHMAISKQLSATIMATGNPTMPDTSFANKVENMTPDQQRAWALQYATQQQAASYSQPVKLPSAGETQFHSAYTSSIATQTAFFDSLTFPWQHFTDEFTKRKNEIDQKYRDEMAKCPHSDNGQGDGGPDPICAASVEKQYQDWLASFYADWLKRVENFILKKKSDLQARYGSMENILAQNNYMSTPSNSVYKTDATSLQQTMLSYEQMLGKIIGETWTDGCIIRNSIMSSESRAIDLKK